MTLHWWMHWFWITRLPALLLVSAAVIALPVGPYTLPTKREGLEQLDLRDGSSITDWPSHISEELLQTQHHISPNYDADMWVGTRGLYHSSTAPTVSSVSRKEMVDPSTKAITKPSISTYLQSGIEQSIVTPLVLYASRSLDSSVTSGSRVVLYPTATEENIFSTVSSEDSSHLRDTEVFRKKSVVSDGKEDARRTKLSLISETGIENQDFSEIEDTTLSIIGVAKNSAANDNSFVVTSSNGITPSVYNSSESISSNSSNISLDLLVHTKNSYSQGIDKPLVNIPHLITRDLRSNSESSLTTSSSISVVTSHEYDHPLPLYLPLLDLNLPIARTGKSAGYFPSQLHRRVLSSPSPSRVEPDVTPSDTVSGYKEGPKNSDEILNPVVAIKDSDGSQLEKGDSSVIWISTTSQVTDVAPNHRKMIPAAEHESSNARLRHLDDAEMADSPYSPPESFTIVGSRIQTFGNGISKPPSASSLDLPIDKAENGTDNKPLDSDDLIAGSREKGQGKEIPKIVPPLATSSEVVNTPSQSGRHSDNVTKISYVSPINSENVDGNASLGSVTDNANSSTVTSDGQSLPLYPESSVLTLPSIVPGLKQVGNVTIAAKDIEDNETTVITLSPTVMPVSDGRIAASAPSGSYHGLDAASITGISLGILVFAALVGAVSFVLYRRRFLNKPQTLNDKCSNPDSSGYIDDSTLRENSEEMYSLDNDSFLNSLEAMTIQNYWTDNVKHTKL
ncbi:uncharacterized protein LOC110840447 isoform X2 [Zootermopsis nevadensis]|uniref:uncharacterized protein LOC110840447 isoform X2 n=1 Tax=Zootermopsis nevadensis TaxID=136037 RepID=UPI000B8E40DD|nr:uncharacterized protein LOC110840447 isoform X2 [Zootermopsis nevadensis]